MGRGPAGLEPGGRPAAGRGRLPRVGRRRLAIVDFAREHGLRVAPQGTGHDAAPARPARRTILREDLAHARRRDRPGGARAPASRPARSGWTSPRPPRARPRRRWPARRPDVGVVGYTLGGGVSWLARKHGLAANSVVAIELVTADGRLRARRRDNEPELFWALRGGGGNFGVVTALEFGLYPDARGVRRRAVLARSSERARCSHAWREWIADRSGRGDVRRPHAAVPAAPGDPGAAARPLVRRRRGCLPRRARPTAPSCSAAARARARRWTRSRRSRRRELQQAAHGPRGAGARERRRDAPRRAARPRRSTRSSRRPVPARARRWCRSRCATSAARSPSARPSTARSVRWTAVRRFRRRHGDEPGRWALPRRRTCGSSQRRSSRGTRGQTYLNFAERPVPGERIFGSYVYRRLRQVKTQYDPADLFRANHPISPAELTRAPRPPHGGRGAFWAVARRKGSGLAMPYPPVRQECGNARPDPGSATFGTRPKGAVRSRRAPHRRPLRGHLHRPAERRVARVDAAADAEGGRVGARPRGRRRLQAAELDDAADGDRGGGGAARADRRSQARGQERGPARDPHRRAPERRQPRHGRVGGAREGRRRTELQAELAAQPHALGEALRLVRREWPTDIGPVDLMCRDERRAAGSRSR